MSTLLRRLRALLELRDVREAMLLAQLCLFGALVPLVLRLPLPRVAAIVSRAPRRRRRAPQPEVERLARVAGLAPRIAHPFVRPGCLTRGVTLFWFLRRAGVPVELRFGVDPLGEDPDGHCWLALEDEPYLEKVDPRGRFTELYRLPLAAA